MKEGAVAADPPGEGELEEKSPKFSLSKVPLSIAVVVQKRNPLDLRQPSGDLYQQQVQEA